MVTTGGWFTVTFTVACAVHPLASVISTVYTDVAVGVMLTELPVCVVLQEYVNPGVPPLAVDVRVAEFPRQTAGTEEEARPTIAPGCVIVISCVCEQPPASETTTV